MSELSAAGISRAPARKSRKPAPNCPTPKNARSRQVARAGRERIGQRQRHQARERRRQHRRRRHRDLRVPADEDGGDGEAARHDDRQQVAEQRAAPVGIRHHDHRSRERDAHRQPRAHRDPLAEEHPAQQPGHVGPRGHEDERVGHRGVSQRQDEARRGQRHAPGHGHDRARPAPLREDPAAPDHPHHQGQEEGGEDAAPETGRPGAGGDEANDEPAAAPAHRCAGHQQDAAPAGGRRRSPPRRDRVRSDGHERGARRPSRAVVAPRGRRPRARGRCAGRCRPDLRLPTRASGLPDSGRSRAPG